MLIGTRDILCDKFARERTARERAHAELSRKVPHAAGRENFIGISLHQRVHTGIRRPYFPPYVPLTVLVSRVSLFPSLISRLAATVGFPALLSLNHLFSDADAAAPSRSPLPPPSPAGARGGDAAQNIPLNISRINVDSSFLLAVSSRRRQIHIKAV